MSFETSLFAVLEATVGKAYPDTAPLSTPKPYATYQFIGGFVINQLNNQLSGKKNAEVQVNVWAATRQQANDLARTVEAAMRAQLNAKPFGAFIGDQEPDLGLYGTRQSFSCWYDA